MTGPGNVYVAAAKRLLKGVIGIDSEAGPTEIGILADAGADPRYLAADLIAQAEHDEQASCGAGCRHRRALVDAVVAELAARCRSPGTASGSRRRCRSRARLLVDDLEQGLAVVDE